MILGAFVGAFALAVIGFKFGGWLTTGQAEILGTQQARTAVATALAPICADKFKRDAKYVSNLAELKKADTWSRGAYIEKGGWATMQGAKAPESQVDTACAALIIGT